MDSEKIAELKRLALQLRRLTIRLQTILDTLDIDSKEDE